MKHDIWTFWLSESIAPIMTFCVHEGFCDLDNSPYKIQQWSPRINQILKDFIEATSLTESLKHAHDDACIKKVLKTSFRSKWRSHPLCAFLTRLRNKPDIEPSEYWEQYISNHRSRERMDQMFSIQRSILTPWILSLPCWTPCQHLLDLGGGSGVLAKSILENTPVETADVIDQIYRSKRDAKEHQLKTVKFHCHDIFTPFYKHTSKQKKTLLLSNILHLFPNQLTQLFSALSCFLGSEDQIVIIDNFSPPENTLITALYQLQHIPTGGQLVTMKQLRLALAPFNLTIQTNNSYPHGPLGYKALRIIKKPSKKQPSS